jgi:hypothetical protein
MDCFPKVGVSWSARTRNSTSETAYNHPHLFGLRHRDGNELERRRVMHCSGFACDAVLEFAALSESNREHLAEWVSERAGYRVEVLGERRLVAAEHPLDPPNVETGVCRARCGAVHGGL